MAALTATERPGDPGRAGRSSRRADRGRACTEAPLPRTLALARPAAGRLALATLLGAGALAAAIGLIATSAWLISRSAQHPQESAVALAIVGVQFFALSRGLLRYGERLVGHDAAFRVLSELRVQVYERLERLAPLGPARLPQRRSAGAPGRRRRLRSGPAGRVVPPFAIATIVGALHGRAGELDAPLRRADPARGAAARGRAGALADGALARARRDAPGAVPAAR